MRIAAWLLCACTLSAQTVTVTGSVTKAITHEPIEGVSVVLFPLNGSSSGANSDASGRFRIPNVKPGQYRLSPSKVGFDAAAIEMRIDPGADPPAFNLTMLPWPTVRGRVLAVGNHDVEGIVVRVSPPVSVSGTIELDGQAGHRCEGDAILAPVDGEGERAHVEFSESGIRFERVYPGRYILTVLPGWTSGRHYLDGVWMGERDLTLNELEVVPGMMPFRVALRTGGARVRGTVENGNGGMVVLTPQDERLRYRPLIVLVSFTGGMFDLDNVRPGSYYAFALQGSFNSDQMQNPEYARLT